MIRKIRVKKHKRKRKSGGSSIVSSHFRTIPQKKLKSLEEWLSPKRGSQKPILEEKSKEAIPKEILPERKEIKVAKIPKSKIPIKFIRPEKRVIKVKPWEKRKSLPRYRLICPKCLHEKLLVKKELTEKDRYCRRCKIEMVPRGTEIPEE